MNHRLPLATRNQGGTLAFLVVALLGASSPLVATSAASNGGADKPVSATHGDCKNINGGVHNGYDCPAPDTAI
jgi:hypothetical protein